MESLLFPAMLALLALFMFFSIRKQKKRVTEMQEMQESVGVGSRIMTTTGLFATVVDSSSTEYVDLETSPGAVSRWNRMAISRVIPTEDAAETYPGALVMRHDPLADEFDDGDDSRPASESGQ